MWWALYGQRGIIIQPVDLGSPHINETIKKEDMNMKLSAFTVDGELEMKVGATLS